MWDTKLKRTMVYLERDSLWEPSPEYIEPTSIQMCSRATEYTQVHAPAYGYMQIGKVEKGHRDLDFFPQIAEEHGEGTLYPTQNNSDRVWCISTSRRFSVAQLLAPKSGCY